MFQVVLCSVSSGTMQILEQTSPPSERQLISFAVDAIGDALPPGWSRAVSAKASTPRFRVTAPDGRNVEMPIEARALLNARDVPALAVRRTGQAGGVTLIVARYLSPRARTALADSGFSYVDATGNVRVSVSDPGLFIMLDGADRDPWRTPDRPTSSLRGVPAARVIRTLVDREPPWKVRELAVAAGTSLGSTARTVGLLDREALIERGDAGEIVSVNWAALLERWAADYELERRRRVIGLLQPRALDTLAAPLGTYGGTYAITGSMAAAQWAPYADGRTALIYATDVDALKDELRLREAPSRPNVLLIEADDDYVFDRSVERDGLRYAAPSQVVVDLLNGPGRNPEEGRELMRWMQANEADWRER